MKWLAALAVVLTGCARQDGPPSAPPSNTVAVLDERGPSFYVHEVRLKDGTRCVVSTTLTGDGGTAIACDWRAPELER